MRAPIIAALALLGAVASAPALACTCSCPADARSLLRDLSYVARGRPVLHREVDNRRAFDFVITRRLKGALPDRITVETPYSGVACGILEANLAPHEEYLIAVRRDGAGYYFDSCMLGCLRQHQAEVVRLLEQCESGGDCPR